MTGKVFRITYTATARENIKRLPPVVKPAIKLLIEKLLENPYAGKRLHAELSGYLSFRFQRWRVIYVLFEEERRIEIQLVEKRVSVYDTLKSISH